jgi:ribosomal protein S25
MMKLRTYKTLTKELRKKIKKEVNWKGKYMTNYNLKTKLKI